MKKNKLRSNNWSDQLLIILLSCAMFLGSSLFNQAEAQTDEKLFVTTSGTLLTVIKQVEKQGDYKFIYDNTIIDVQQPITVATKDQSIKSVLSKILQSTDISYQIKGNDIILTKKSVAKASLSAISGRVLFLVDTTPVIGAMAIIQGTTIGAISDADGRFTIPNVKPADVIEVSYLGYKSISKPAADNMLFLLDVDALKVNEVVVVGYGVQRRQNITSSIATVDARALENRAISNVSQGLQGLVPGMTITNSGGQPGMNEASIKIRGTGSFNATSPMILIDGIEGDMNLVDPQDVASISVLKDAASAAIYGSKAANGVILITTKRGRQGTPTISYNGQFGWSSPTSLIRRTSSADLAQLTNESEYWGAISEGATVDQARKRMPYSPEDIRLYADGSSPYTHPNTDWNDLFYVGSGFMNKHNIAISGGTDNVNYRTSVGYNNQKGIVKNAMNRQFNLRTNLDIKIIEKLKATVNLDYANTYNEEPTNPLVWDSGSSEQTYRQVNRISPMVVNKYEDGTYGTISDGNPIAFQESGAKGKRQYDRITAFAELAYNIFDGFEAKVNGSYFSNNQDYNLYRPEIQYNPQKYDGPTQLTQTYYTDRRSQADVLLTYDKVFGGKHSVNLLAGGHTELYTYKTTSAYRKNFPSTDVSDVDGGSIAGMSNSGNTRELAINSFFARAQYGYDDRYLVDMNIRGDASSRFAEGYRMGWFPSVSAAWRISNEKFMQSAKHIISELKIRGSWGKLGNQQIPNDYYPYINTYSTSPKYPFDDQISVGAAQTNNKINNLSWETTRTAGVGVDLVLFNRLSVTLDYYDRKTTGILMQVNVPTTFGYGGYYDNIGAMSNKGLEAAINYNETFGEVLFSAGVNFSVNKNKVLNLGDINDQKSSRSIVRVGYAYQAFYGYKSDGLFQNQSEIDAAPRYTMIDNARLIPGDIKLVDTDGNGVVNDDDKVILNSSDPKVTFGLNLGVKWRFIDLSLFFQGAAGVTRYFTDEMYGEFNGDSGHPSNLWLDRWTPENPTNTMPRASKFRTYNMPEVTTSDFWLVNTNYLRLKDVQVGFTLPKRWLESSKVSNIRVYYSGQNLFTLKNCPKGFDPEAPSGWGAYYPQVMTNSVGVSITF